MFVSSDHRISCLMLLSLSHPFCKLQVCCHVAFSQEWLPSGHSPIKPRLVKCCRDWFSKLSHWVVGQLPDQGPSCPVAQFGRMANSSLNFPMMETTVLLETFNTLEIVLYPSPDMSHNNFISEIYGQFFGFHGIVSALTCTVNWTFFLNHVQTFELATIGLQSSCSDVKDDRRKLDAPELNLSCHSKGV